MNTRTLKLICGKFAGAESTLYGDPANVLVYSVAGKKFAYFKTSEPEKWRFSIRVTPDRFVELTDVPGIKPARYMGRFHWVTIVHADRLSSDYLIELIEWSYRNAVSKLTMARRSAPAGAVSKSASKTVPRRAI
ncbi:hypothetical protein BH11PSE11_BH11PSE11_21130 [soil metagenome]